VITASVRLLLKSVLDGRPLATRGKGCLNSCLIKGVGRSLWLVATWSNGATAASDLQALKTGQIASVLLRSESKQSNFSPKPLVHPSKAVLVRPPITLLSCGDRGPLLVNPCVPGRDSLIATGDRRSQVELFTHEKPLRSTPALSALTKAV
jgi:hypothetical protein